MIVAGLPAGRGAAAELVRDLKLKLPTKPESLLIRLANWEGRKTLLLAGADDRGLMYALLDTADRIGWAANVADPLSEIRNTVENPAVAQRALSIYTMHRATFEQRFFDEDREAVRPNVQFSFPARCPLSRKYGGNVRRRPFD